MQNETSNTINMEFFTSPHVLMNAAEYMQCIIEKLRKRTYIASAHL